MKILSDGTPVGFLTWSYCESFNKNCSELCILAPVDQILDTVTVESDSGKESVEYQRVTMTFQSPEASSAIYYPSSYIKALSHLYPLFKGYSSLEDLYSNYGIELQCTIATKESYWVLPDTRYQRLLDLTIMHASYQGGGPIATWKANGIYVTDLLSTPSWEPIWLTGTVVKSVQDMRWEVNEADVYNYVQFMLDGTTQEDFTLDNDNVIQTKSYFREVVFNDLLKDRAKQFLKNKRALNDSMSYMLYLTGVDTEVIPSIDQLITFESNNENYRVLETKITTTQASSNVDLILCHAASDSRSSNKL